MFTYEEYINKKCSHREYYAQFVSKRLQGLVALHIGRSRILASNCKHFNDIPLKLWDNMRPCISAASLGEAVCILKEAAQQIREATK